MLYFIVKCYQHFCTNTLHINKYIWFSYIKKKKINKTSDPSTEVEIMMQLLYWVVHPSQNTSTALILLEN